MKINKIANILRFTVAISMIGGPAMAGTNKALEEWKAFAAEQNNPNYHKWVELISDPKAIKLAKEWKELRGYDAHELIEKANIPADLKPGLVITKDNKGDYPWLKDYLPKEMYEALDNKWGNIGQIKIVPTNTYYMHEGYLKGTRALKDKNIKLKVNVDGDLLYQDDSYALISGDATTAIPFLEPKSGIELNWNYVAHSTNSDTMSFDPIKMNSCTKKGDLDRQYKANLWWWHYHNRSNEGPIGNIEGKERFIEGGSVFFLEPNDIRGMAGVRQRYAQQNKKDDFKVFLPSLRRTRLLTGSDSQDPLASGLELTWDDWRSYWVKTDLNSFEYKMLGEKLILASPEVGHAYDSHVMTPDKCNWASIELELRPTWILEINDKKGKYQYSKRQVYIDKEFYYAQYMMTWDPRGNPFRNWDDVRDFRPSIGDMQWSSVLSVNQVTKRISTLFMTSIWEGRDEDVTDEMFDIDQLRDYQ